VRMNLAETTAAPEGERSAQRLIHLALGFRAAKVLLSAVELDLFTQLAVAPLPGETLRQRLGLHQRGAGDFFDALAALGLLERRGGLYHNTAETALHLDRNKPGYVGGFLQFANAKLYPAWASLTEALRTGKPQSGLTDGDDLFDAEYLDPASVARYARAMSGASLPVAADLTRRFRWADVRTFIDIGAAEGAIAVEIAKAHPHLTGGGFDLPAMQPVFESYAESNALGERLRFYPGDFLNGPLPAADVLVMGHILHDWNLQVKRALLAKAHEALPRGGALIVYDQMIDDLRCENAAGLLMSLNMLLRTQGGFDYTGAECIGWLREAGFVDVRCERLREPFSMVTGVKGKA
jgi:O-methyltransferase domain/Dimerisation domain